MKLFKKTKSRFYWFDFTVRGQRYRGSTGETKAVRATKVASMKLAQAVEHGDLFSARSTVLFEFSERFLTRLDEARVEEKTRKYYRNGCRLLKATPLFSMRLTEITTADAERLKFPGSGGQRQLCIANSQTSPAYSRRVETDCSRSEDQIAEGARAGCNTRC